MSAPKEKGMIAWFAGNHAFANLLMIVFIVGGLYMSTQIKKEVFPEFSLDRVSISVSYPGASPEEVEQGIVLVLEEAVQGVSGIGEVTASASEGRGSVDVELLDSYDPQVVYQNIKQEVDRIRTFPEDAEEPNVSLDVRRREVLDVQVYGDVTEWALRDLTEGVRDELLAHPDITQVEYDAARRYEIAIEIPQETLRRHNLTLNECARIINLAAIETPAGAVKTDGGEILVRMDERRDWAREFSEIPMVSSPDGAIVKLGSIAKVTESFEDTNEATSYDGMRSINLEVYRVGDETPITVSAATHEVLDRVEQDLPPKVFVAINRDRSEMYQQRLHLLMKNAFLGLCLVLIILGLFLEVHLAFWVLMGIPTSFLGAILFLPFLGVTINMISMFAFIVALGIVVDDAIVAGENIYEKRQQGMPFMQAAVEGAREVATPIGFSILTNIVAFAPLMFVPGYMGKIWYSIPMVVSAAFVISWVEALFILPAHLSHGHRRPPGMFRRFQLRFAKGLEWFSTQVYGTFIKKAVAGRYLSVAIGLGALTLFAAWPLSGRMGLVLMPRVESDEASCTASLPFGSPMSEALRVRDRLVDAALVVIEENGGEELSEGLLATIDGDQVRLRLYLTPPELRPISTTQLANLWREETGDLAGVDRVRFESESHFGRGAAITVDLSHRNIDVLDRASAALALQVEQLENTKDVDDGYRPGKPQMSFKLNSSGRALGLTSTEVGRQVRSSFVGQEAIRQQRGRNEVRVRVRLPKEERDSEQDIDNMLVRTPSGTFVRLMEIATLERGRAFTSISRRSGKRTVSVTAGVDPLEKTEEILTTLKKDVLPQLQADYPGLSYTFEGRQATMRESMSALVGGFALAMFIIYGLLIIPFRNFLQPIVILFAIPFGIIGGVFGHLVMGYSMSIISMMGIIALSGVVVNDALVMLDFAKRKREEGETPEDAIEFAGIRRFRPILLTTLTTFCGLSPMIFETSRQARFMVPMAISLGFGILFATAITLVLIPCLYMIVDDFERLVRRLFVGEPTQ